MPSTAPQTTPALSLILCSRNDQYMGNSRWRLETALEWTAGTLAALGRDNDVEILVTDWGSAAPLREAIALSPVAARLTRFITVPPDRATALQRDSPFAEVIALNIAARRARGTWIGRIDQDTLVGPRFFRCFFAMADGDEPVAMGFSNVRHIPYRLAVRCPPFTEVAGFIRTFGDRLRLQHRGHPGNFWEHSVGIWLVRADVWNECGGYDERMIYMNAMESNMVKRLLMKHPIVDLGARCGHDFYHLEHYDPWTPRRSSVYRTVNPHVPFSAPDTLNPTGPEWGLPGETFDIDPAARAAASPVWPTGRGNALASAARLLPMLPALVTDRLGPPLRRQVERAARALRALLQARSPHA